MEQQNKTLEQQYLRLKEWQVRMNDNEKKAIERFWALKSLWRKENSKRV